MLSQCRLTWTSTLGIVYVASPRTRVRYGSTSWHHGFVSSEPPLIDEVGRTRRSSPGPYQLRQLALSAGVREPAPGARPTLDREAVAQPRVDVDVHALPVLGLLAEVARARRELVDQPDLAGTRSYRPLTV